jgi:ribose transport system permease protein
VSATTSADTPEQVSGGGKPSRRRAGSGGGVARYVEAWSGLGVWVLIIILFGIIEPSTFLTGTTVKSVLSNQAITTILAMGLILPLAAGVYDLSIGGTMGITMMLVAWFQSAHHIGFVLAIILTIIAALIIGCVNAFVVVKLGVDSFIATLGMGSVLDGLVQWISGGSNIVEGISPKFLDISTAQIFTIALPVLYMLILGVILWYVIEYRQFGRYMFATGSNPDAARLAGVRTDRLRALSLIICAVIAGIAGILFTSKIGSAAPGTGDTYLLPAFAGALLGATQVRPGRVNVLGTLIAVYLLATGIQGLELAGAQVWVQDVFYGGGLIIAVAFAARAARRRRD